MPISEQQAATITQAFPTLPVERQAEARRFLEKYRTQQQAANQPLFPSEVKREIEAKTRMRQMFDDPAQVDTLVPGFRDMAQFSSNVDTLRKRAANKQYLERVAGRPIGLDYERARAAYSSKEFGQPLDDAQFFAKVGERVKKEAADEEKRKVSYSAGAEAALKAGNPYVRALAEHRAAGEDADTEGFGRGYYEIAQRLAPYRRLVDEVSKDGKAMLTSPDGYDWTALAKRMLEIPAKDRGLVLQALGQSMAAQEGGEDANPAIRLAMAFDRGLERYLDNAMTGVASMLANRAIDALEAIPTPPGMQSADVEGMKAQRGEMAEFLNLRDDLRDVINGNVNPIEDVRLLGANLSGVAENLPMTLSAFVPWAGPAAMVASFQRSTYNELRRENPGMDEGTMQGIATLSAPFQALTEVVSDRLLFGRLPNLKRAFTSPALSASSIAKQLATRVGVGTATEYTEEFVQGVTPRAIQSLVAALDKDVPDVDWSGFFKRFGAESGELLAVIVPMALLGAGVGQISDYAGTMQLAQSPELLKLSGFENADAIAEAAKAGDTKLTEKLMRENWAAVAPEGQSPVEVMGEAAQKAEAKFQEEIVKPALEEVRRRMADEEAQLALQQQAERLGLIPRIRRDSQGWLVEDRETGAFTRVKNREEAMQHFNVAMSDMERQSSEAMAQVADEFMQMGGERQTEEIDIQRSEQTLTQEVEAGRVNEDEARKAVLLYARMNGLTEDQALREVNQVLGNNVEETREGVRKYVSRINGGANLLTVIHEGVHGRWNAGLRSGHYTHAMGLQWVRMAEQASGATFLPEGIQDGDVTAQMLDEAIVEVVQADAVGRRKTGGHFTPGLISRGLASFALGQRAQAKETGRLRAFLKAWKEFWGQVLKRAKQMQKARKEGKLGGDFDAIMDDLLGGEPQLTHEAGAIQEAESMPFSLQRNALGTRLSDLMPEKPSGESLDLVSAYGQASQGSGSAFVSVDDVWKVAQGQNPKANLADFQTQMRAMVDRGEAFMEPSEGPRDTAEAGVPLSNGMTGVRVAMIGESGAAFSLGPRSQQDADYLAAVEAGDLETAQRMVDEAAKAAGYDSARAFHGTASNFTQFKRDNLGQMTGAQSARLAFFFTDSEPTAMTYARKAATFAEDQQLEKLLRDAAFAERRGNWDEYERLILEAENLEFGEGAKERRQKLEDDSARVLNVYLRGKYLELDAGGNNYVNIDNAPDFDQFNGSLTAALEFARDNGFDGVRIDNFDDAIDGTFTPATHWAVFDPSQIKLADPVTYDEAGNVIPLSERFNPESNDIRFSRPALGTRLRDLMQPQQTESIEDAYRVAAEGQGTGYVALSDIRDRVPAMSDEAFTRAVQDLVQSGRAFLDPVNEVVEGQVTVPIPNTGQLGGWLYIQPDTGVRFSRPAVTEQDREYMTAVERGDVARQQELVDEAINDNLPKDYYHGGAAGGKGHIVQFVFGRPDESYWQGATKKRQLWRTKTTRQLTDEMIQFGAEYFTLDEEAAKDLMNPGNIIDTAGAWDDPQFVSEFWQRFENDLLKNGDALKVGNGAIAFPGSESIERISDPITYDDQGNIIPPSQRFKPESNDIRFSLAPRSLASYSDTVLASKMRKPEFKEAFYRVARERLAALMSSQGWRGGAESAADKNRTLASLKRERQFRLRSRQRELMEQIPEKVGDNAMLAYEAGSPELEAHPFIAHMLGNHGRLMSWSTAQAQGRADMFAGEWDDAPMLPPSFYAGAGSERWVEVKRNGQKEIYSVGQIPAEIQSEIDSGKAVARTIKRQRPQSQAGGIMPDVMAQSLYDDGLLNSPDVSALWAELESILNSHKSAKADFSEARKQIKALEREARETAKKEADEWFTNAKAAIPTPKERQLMALRTLDAILSAFPAEVRGKVGGFVKLAELTTDKAREKEIGKRLDLLDKVVEKYAKDYYLDKINEAVSRYSSERKNGTMTGKLIADKTEIFNYLDWFRNLSLKEQDKEIAGLEDTIRNSQDTAEIDDAVAKLGFAESMYRLDEQSSESLEKTHQWMVEEIEQGRLLKKLNDNTRANMIRSLVEDGISRVSNGERPELTDAENTDAIRENHWLLSKLDNIRGMLGEFLWTTTQQLERVFGEDAAVVSHFGERLIEGFNKKEDMLAEIEKSRRGMLEDVFGTKSVIKQVGGMARLRKARKSGVYRTVGRKTEKVRVPIEEVPYILEGKRDPGSVGISSAEVEQLREKYDPTNKRVKGIEVEREVNKGRQEELIMSEMEAIQYILTWRQVDARDNMERDGWTEKSIEQAEAFLSDQSRQIMAWMMEWYAKGGDIIDPVYRNIYNAPLPRVKNYAPTIPALSNKDQITPLDMQAVNSGLSAGFTKSRRPHARPYRRVDAVVAFMAHWENVAHWVSYAETVRDMKAVLLDETLQAGVRAQGMSPEAEALKTRIRAIESKGSDNAWQLIQANRFMSLFNQFRAFKGLSFRLSPIVKQTSAILNPLLLDVPAESYLVGVGRLMAGKLDVAEMWKSNTIQRRLENGFSAEARVAMQTMGVSSSQLVTLMQRGMLPMALTDVGWTTAGAAIAYDYYKRQAVKSGQSAEQAKATAEKAVDRMIARTAQPVDPNERALIENQRNPFVKSMWMFASESRKALAIELMALERLMKGKSKSKRMDLQRIVVAHVLQGLLTQFMASIYKTVFGSDDDREETWSAEEWAAAIAAGPINGLFVIGGAIEFVIKKIIGAKAWAGQANPLVKSVEDVYYAGSNLEDLFNGDEDDMLDELFRVSAAAGAVTASLGFPLPGTIDVVLMNPANEIRKAVQD